MALCLRTSQHSRRNFWIVLGGMVENDSLKSPIFCVGLALRDTLNACLFVCSVCSLIFIPVFTDPLDLAFIRSWLSDSPPCATWRLGRQRGSTYDASARSARGNTQHHEHHSIKAHEKLETCFWKATHDPGRIMHQRKRPLRSGQRLNDRRNDRAEKCGGLAKAVRGWKSDEPGSEPLVREWPNPREEPGRRCRGNAAADKNRRRGTPGDEIIQNGHRIPKGAEPVRRERRKSEARKVMYNFCQKRKSMWRKLRTQAKLTGSRTRSTHKRRNTPDHRYDGPSDDAPKPPPPPPAQSLKFTDPEPRFGGNRARRLWNPSPGRGDIAAVGKRYSARRRDSTVQR